MVICFLSINLAMFRLASMFGTTYGKVERIIDRYVPLMAARADSLWDPKSPPSEADWCSFTFNPEAVAAIDSTPLRAPDCPCSRYLRKALWCPKPHETAWKLTAAVAPNGICVWRGLLVCGRRNDKRAVDESGAPQAFLIVADDGAGGWREMYLPMLFDMGYPGIHHYRETAIMKTRPTGAAGEYEHFKGIDSDRAVVECFFGRLKKRFRILSDESYRGSLHLFEDIVTLCIALANERHRSRGYAEPVPRRGFVRIVPRPVSVRVLARGIPIRRAKRPKIHAPYSVTGLSPSNARECAMDPRRDWPPRAGTPANPS
jgi:hypothetical protein